MTRRIARKSSMSIVGTITAKAGDYAAGIASGYYHASCGSITIDDTCTKVTATKGKDSNTIGAGYRSSCGTVTIGGEETGSISDIPYTYEP